MNGDFIVQDFNIPPHPKGVVLNDKTVRLKPLNVAKRVKIARFGRLSYIN